MSKKGRPVFLREIWPVDPTLPKKSAQVYPGLEIETAGYQKPFS